METEALKLAASQGIWALLFVSLLLYVLKKQEARDKKAYEREANYQIIITQLMEKLNVIETVADDVNDIKDALFK
ncbi:bacteriocin UviB precursor [Oxobacter pfennigii]|uniref:Bacteriocin UviB n=1 Tax=Oxobacter pfennigii TaxID=36849 RepID=A0A0P9AC63_9CLOT|nr:BhlA/UviB family holin-like peptide [Oxobacter pfennigii]KPU42684.1 bacteriocin UviB precursor [Oxobacter pfennigii]